MGFLARTHDARATWSGPFTLKETNWETLNAQFFGDGGGSASGIHVNEWNAFTFSALYDGVNQISSDVAKLPLNLHKRLQGGGSEHYLASKTHRLLKSEPNPEMTAMVFRRTLIAHALTLKGGFAEIERDQLGRPFALWLLDPRHVQMERRGTDQRLVYVVRENGVDDVVLESRDVLHIHGLGYDGYCAYPLIEMARNAIGMALAAEQFGGSFFGHGSTFGGVLKNAPSDPEEREELRRVINEQHAGPERAHKFLMLWGAMEYAKLGVDPTDAQMKELREQQVEEVARFLNISVYKLKLTKPGAMSYASIEQNALEYHKGPILNWCTLLEQECDRKLIPRLEQSQQFFKHNTNAFLRGDIKSRFEALEIAKRNGVINADQWLDLEDMNPQAGGQGQLYLVQEQYIPVDRINELLDSKIAKNEAPPPTPAPPSGGADREIALLTERAERAEQLAEAAREALTEARELNAAMAGNQGATEAERDAARAAEAKLITQVATLEQLARDTQADAVRAHEGRALAETREYEAITAKVTAETEARERIAAAEARERALAVELDALRIQSEQAQAARQAAEAAYQSAQANEMASMTEAHAAIDAHEAAKHSLEALTKERDRLLSDVATLRLSATASAEERAEVDARLADAEQRAEAARLAFTESQQQRSAALEAERVTSAANEQATAERASAKAEAERLQQALAELEARQQAETAATRQYQAAVVAAHRGLIVDALGRMTRREVQQAKAKQATQQKLRAWLSGFPALHEAVCLEALLPAMRVHLAWTGSTEDPADVTASFVAEHIAAFTAQVRIALDADPDDFHAVLDKVLTRWERDRAESVADAIVTKEIRHIQG